MYQSIECTEAEYRVYCCWLLSVVSNNTEYWNKVQYTVTVQNVMLQESVLYLRTNCAVAEYSVL